MAKFPPWLKKRVPCSGQTKNVRAVLKNSRLPTVCREARCPNAGECYARGTATFMILGSVCTRNCAFCAVQHGEPGELEEDEPARLAGAAEEMELRHVVVTSVTRDDLPDGGSSQFAATIRALHDRTDASVEVLTPDFEGRKEDVVRVLQAAPEVFNHNVETVPRLYPEVRPQAEYERSLDVLEQAARNEAVPVVKSGLMVGMGETEAELLDVFGDLLEAGCQVLTVGQYLRPSEAHHEVVEFVRPEDFQSLRDKALDMGFDAVASGPFVRSSYRARELAEEAGGL